MNHELNYNLETLYRRRLKMQSSPDPPEQPSIRTPARRPVHRRSHMIVLLVRLDRRAHDCVPIGSDGNLGCETRDSVVRVRRGADAALRELGGLTVLGDAYGPLGVEQSVDGGKVDVLADGLLRRPVGDGEKLDTRDLSLDECLCDCNDSRQRMREERGA